MRRLGLFFLLYFEFLQLSSGEVGTFYRYSFYWEYEFDGLNIHKEGMKNLNRFDPARTRLGVLMRSYYEDARKRTQELNNIRFVVEETFQYELGYITHEMYAKYRKLVEQFNRGERNHSLVYLNIYKNKKPMTTPDRLIFGNDNIERTEVAQKLYFEIFHLSNMIHELTRKWGVGSIDQSPTFGTPKGVKHTFFYDTASYKLHQAELQKEKEKYMKRLNRERNRIVNQMYKKEQLAKKKKFTQSNEHFGVDKDAEGNTNDFIKSRMKEQGWEKWHKERTNGSYWYRPRFDARDYGWDVPYTAGHGH